MTTRTCAIFEGDRLVMLQHEWYLLIAVVMAGLVPAILGLAWGDPLGALLWAGCLRLVAQYHATFAINSMPTGSAGGRIRTRRRPETTRSSRC